MGGSDWEKWGGEERGDQPLWTRAPEKKREACVDVQGRCRVTGKEAERKGRGREREGERYIGGGRGPFKRDCSECAQGCSCGHALSERQGQAHTDA